MKQTILERIEVAVLTGQKDIVVNGILVQWKPLHSQVAKSKLEGYAKEVARKSLEGLYSK
jgi:hypothetical protein